MPSNKSADLKQVYHKLLQTRFENAKAGIHVIGLDKWISEQESTMDSDDVEYVRRNFKIWADAQP